MDWIPTPQSSDISQFAYDENSQILMVGFKKGSVYNYYDVPEHVFEAMKNAPSKGKFLYREIKGRYRYVRA